MDLQCPCCRSVVDETPALTGFDRLHGVPGTFEVALCPACGAGITLPILGPAALGEFYPDEYGVFDVAQGHLVRRVSSLIQRWQGWLSLRTPPLRSIAGSTPGRAVDVGCGRGDMAAYLIERGWRVTGVEPSAKACSAARARGVETRQGTVDAVSLESGAYDAAILRQSLEHITDPVAALGRVWDALRPGGLVLISVPNFGCWQRRRFAGRWFHLDLPRHRVHFTESALSSALERAGFDGAELSTSTTPVGLPASIQYALAGRCLFPSGLGLRVASGLCALAWPVARLADGLGGGGDVLNATARRPL